MLRKLTSLLVAFAILAFCGMPVFAAGVDIQDKNEILIGNILRDPDSETNDVSIVNIKKPDDVSITTFKESYTLTGETEHKNVKIYLAKYDEATKEYVPFENSDGESSWKIGTYGMFAKEILLNKGANKFKLLAVVVSDAELLTEDEIQVKVFTISYFEKSLAERFQEGIKDFKEALGKVVDLIK